MERTDLINGLDSAGLEPATEAFPPQGQASSRPKEGKVRRRSASSDEDRAELGPDDAPPHQIDRLG
jgi:hypothetical protein